MIAFEGILVYSVGCGVAVWCIWELPDSSSSEPKPDYLNLSQERGASYEVFPCLDYFICYAVEL